MPNETINTSGEKPVKIRPKVVCSWNNPAKKWDIDILDDDGKIEISPVRRNQLLRQLRMSLNRRKRELGVRRYAQREQLVKSN